MNFNVSRFCSFSFLFYTSFIFFFYPQLTASLTAVAESMRNCASFVETFAATIQGPQIATGTLLLFIIIQIFHLTRSSGLSFVPDDGLTKGVKRKAVDHDEESDPKKRKRKPRDPNAPKRPASSYILFQNDIRKELKEKHPNVPNNELLAMISKLWNDMPDQEKKASRVASSCHYTFP